MAAAARQGLPVLYAGGHGTGPWGDLVRAALAAEGIGLLRPPDPDRDTGFDVALVEPDAERTFVTHLGAEAVRGPGGLGRGAGRAGRRGLRVRLRPGPAATPARPSATGRPRCRLVSLLFVDPGPLVAQIPAAVLDPVLGPLRLAELQPPGGRVAYQHGASGTGIADAAAAPVRRTRQATRRSWPAACSPAAPPRTSSSGTGAAGCYVARSGRQSAVHVRAPKVTAVDTTGAGDAHSARSSPPSPTAFRRSTPPPGRTRRPPSR